MTTRFNRIFLLFLVSLPTFGFAQVIDSVIVRVMKAYHYDEPWRITGVEADSLSAGRIIYHTGAELNSAGWPANMLQYVYDSTGQIIEEICPYAAAPSVHQLYYFNAIADTVLRQNNNAGTWVNDSLQVNWHNSLGHDSLIFSYYWENVAWQNAFRYDRYFDTGGNLIDQIKSGWDTILGSWTYKQQILYQGNSTMIWQNWDGNNWINNWEKMVSLTYDNDFLWSPSDSTWYIYTGRSYFYNGSNQLISAQINNYPGTVDINYTYDINGNLIEEYSSYLSMGGYPSAWQTLYYRFAVPSSSSSLFVVSSDYSLCSADSAQMNPQVFGGTAPYHYSWFPSAGLSSDTIPDPYITSDTTTIFNLTVTDSMGLVAVCTVEADVRRSVDAHISIGAVDTTSLCNSAVLNFSSSDPVYIYWFFNGQIISTINHQLHITQNGIYSVQANSSGLCRSTTSININFLTHTAAAAIIHPDSCLHQLIADCPSCVSFQWYANNVIMQGSNNDTLQVGSDGYYSIHTVDSNQCLNTTPILHFYPYRANVFRHNDNPCSGDCMGQLGIAVWYGHYPYTYLWSTSDTISYLDSLCAGIYSLMITDAIGCVLTISDTIKTPSPLSLFYSQYPAILPDSCSGRIAIAPAGGYQTSGYQTSLDSSSYQFCNSGDTAIFNYVCIGWNYITISNSWCSKTDSVFVNLSPGCSITTQGTDPVCYGACDGNIISTAGGTPPFRYDWSSGDSAAVVANICSGTYSVILVDSMGCRDTGTITLNDPVLLQLNTSSQATTCISCSDGIIIVSCSGGTPPFQINLIPALGILVNDTVYNLPAGNYSVCITEASGCTTCDTITVLDDPLLVAVMIASHEFFIYPNPANNHVIVDIRAPKFSEANITMMNMFGQTVLEETHRVNQSVEKVDLDVSSFPSGIYFVQMQRGDFREVQKVVINK